MRVDRSAVLAFRARANHLASRLPDRSRATVAFAGLQDSSPRSAVLSLHARVHDVEPGDWETDPFVQVWGPRGAVFVVTNDDLAVFTLGLLPRDPTRRRQLEAIADEVAAGRADEADQFALRMASATGRLRIRWDASTTTVTAAARPPGDPEATRRELLRRHLRSVGPSTVTGFGWWAGVSAEDAQQTWDGLIDELRAVHVDDEPAWILDTDAAALTRAEPVVGARLLPPGDPYLGVTDRALVVPAADRRRAVWPPSNVWPGAVLLDGELAGTWRRRQRKVTITMWHPPTAAAREAIGAEAASLPIEGPRASVMWE